jgi:hypothetical protein
MKKQLLLVFLLATTLSFLGYSQGTPADDSTTHRPKVEPLTKFPEVKGYVGLVVPFYTWSSDGNQPNFRDYFVIGNPWGINIWKSKKVGISLEFAPFIKTDSKTSKLSYFLFHPGVCYRLGHEFTFIFRAAYETTGRYGFTPIINKVYWRGKDTNLFAAILLPTRFGNSLAPSLTVGFQFGLGF